VPLVGPGKRTSAGDTTHTYQGDNHADPLHVADGDLDRKTAVGIEFIATDLLHDIFGVFAEVEQFPGAEETKIVFPAGTGYLTQQAADILTANVVARIDKEIEGADLPDFTVTVTHADDSHPDSQTVYSYREVLGIYPWLLATLPTTWEEAYTWSLEWVSGLTKTAIRG